MDFLNDLEPVLRVFWWIALPVSLIFIIQMVLTFIGGDATDGLHADFDGDLSGGDTPFQLFSFRNLINFLLGFSWTGISFYHSISSTSLLIGLSVVVGSLFVAIFFIIIKQIRRLEEDNSFQITNALDKTAEVYLPIPAEKSGKGKVLISVKGSMHELEAITEKGRIETGKVVKVVRIESNQLLVVETL